jgi:branched-chain amino acid transport system ATP-binding protein
MTDPDVLLKMDRVEVTYNGAIVALHDVSLTVQRGVIVAVLGANGAGKTTTLKAVSNLLPPETRPHHRRNDCVRYCEYTGRPSG